MDIFAIRIKELRTSKGLTLKDVSSVLGIHLMTYAHYEHGDREPSLDTIRNLAHYYEVSSDYLLGLTDID